MEEKDRIKTLPKDEITRRDEVAKRLEQLTKMLSAEQHARVGALREARSILAGDRTSLVARPVDAIDLINVASWILDGIDPWAPADDDAVRYVPEDHHNTPPPDPLHDNPNDTEM